DFWSGVFVKSANDDLLTLPAAVSFYLALSLSPFLLILLAALSSLGPALQDELVVQIAVLVGDNASQAIAAIINNMRGSKDGTVSIVSAISLITLLVSASAVFGQLKHSVDLIIRRAEQTEGPPAEESYSALIWSFLKRKLLTIGVVLTFILISIVSLVASSVIGFFIARFDTLGVKAAELANTVVSLAVFSAFFTAVFRWVPGRKIAWKPGFHASLVTAVLFMMGKMAIGIYLSSGAVSSSYGAAGSFLALLIWVYYSALIIFFGAEIANELQNWKERR
ncbi:MAG TPA: YihY/virulence factor BrkB family protein, partial [Pseudobdellovibrionaceae bacterium]|nr:YihY/virulence factor BrkB family protein [Pseudobdellovibrionaceae bacterium]